MCLTLRPKRALLCLQTYCTALEPVTNEEHAMHLNFSYFDWDVQIMTLHHQPAGNAVFLRLNDKLSWQHTWIKGVFFLYFLRKEGGVKTFLQPISTGSLHILASLPDGYYAVHLYIQSVIQISLNLHCNNTFQQQSERKCWNLLQIEYFWVCCLIV